MPGVACSDAACERRRGKLATPDIQREYQHDGGEEHGEPGDFEDDGAAEDRQDAAQCRPKDKPTHIGAGEPAIGDPAFAFRHEVGNRRARSRSKRGGPKPLDEAQADQPANR